MTVEDDGRDVGRPQQWPATLTATLAASPTPPAVHLSGLVASTVTWAMTSDDCGGEHRLTDLTSVQLDRNPVTVGVDRLRTYIRHLETFTDHFSGTAVQSVGCVCLCVCVSVCLCMFAQYLSNQTLPADIWHRGSF